MTKIDAGRVARGLKLGLVAGAASFALAPIGAWAQSSGLPALPSVKIVRGELISPSAADGWYATQPGAITDGLCSTYSNNAEICPGGSRPRAPEIRELARALKHDPNLIFEYVRNGVDTEFLFGTHKGPLGVIIDRSGTPFDQAQLLVELFRESGINARYRYGTMQLDGAQFEAWTGITNAKAACDFLATGGIPATVSSCGAGDTVSSVTVSHIWVEADVGGGWRFFDPSYKPYQHKTGINVRQAMGFTSGEVSTALGTGNPTTISTGLSSLGQLDSGALSTKLGTYSTSLLARLNEPDMQGASLDDVIGGRVILAATRPSGGWLLAKPGNYTTTQDPWTTNIPDRYRAKLKLFAQTPAIGATPAQTYIDVVFFGDETYGRRMELGLQAEGEPGFQVWKSVLRFDGVDLAVGPTMSVGIPAEMTLLMTADHPFAAPATSGGTQGTLGDAVAHKTFNPFGSSTIVAAWGGVSASLANKWQAEQGFDRPGILTTSQLLQESGSQPTSSGDLLRARLAATWLAQYTQSANIHAQLAGARPVLLHTLGVVSAEVSAAPVPATPWQPDVPIGDELVGFNIYDEVTVVDLESSFGLVSRSSNAGERRAGVMAIAVTAAALEGSIVAELTDNPDAASLPARLAWGNNPEVGETQTTTSRTVYRFETSGAAASALNYVTYEGGAAAVPADDPVPAISLSTVTSARQRLANTIQNYASAGFDVVTSGEASLGPGHRIGSEYPQYSYIVEREFGGPSVYETVSCVNGPGTTYEPPNGPDWENPTQLVETNFFNCQNGGSWGHLQWTVEGSYSPGDSVSRLVTEYSRLQTLQRGGAMVAIKYDSANPDEPIEIANVLTRRGRPTKGGGGASVTQLSTFTPNQTAETIKDRFSDRSDALGVDLGTGTAGFSSPVLDSVGPGEFPMRLERSVVLRGGTLSAPPPYAFELGGNAGHLDDGPASNWLVSAEISNSAYEAMGRSRVQAAAPTLAAFVAMQDTYSLPKGAKREVSGALIADWWADRLSFNVVSVQQGGSTKQFVRLFDGSFLPTSGGAERLTMTGTRTVMRPKLQQMVRDRGAEQEESVLRGWKYNAISFQLTGASGDVQTFSYWGSGISITPDPDLLDIWRGWRLNTWTFPQGVKLTLDYGSATTKYPTKVSSNLGYELTIPAPSTWVYDATVVPSAPCGYEVEVEDRLEGVTRLELRAPQLRTAYQRPDPYCRVQKIFTPNDASVASIEYGFDSLGRVKEARDGVAIRTPDLRGSHKFYIAEGYRAERVDPEGGRYAVEWLQDGLLSIHTDELGRPVTTVLDGRGRTLSRTYPEGDREEFTYDPRDNITSLTRYPKPGSGLSALVTTATFGEGAVVFCSNPVTCNKPVAVDGPLAGTGDTVNYTWNTTTGQLTKVEKPSDGTTRPETTFSYTTYSAGTETLSLLTGLTEKIDASTTVSTVLAYDTANRFLLKSVTVDPGTPPTNLNLRTCYQYDTTGNLVGVSDPRTTTCPATIQ